MLVPWDTGMQTDAEYGSLDAHEKINIQQPPPPATTIEHLITGGTKWLYRHFLNWHMKELVLYCSCSLTGREP